MLYIGALERKLWVACSMEYSKVAGVVAILCALKPVAMINIGPNHAVAIVAV